MNSSGNNNKKRALNNLNAAFISMGVLALVAIVFSCRFGHPIVALLISLASLATGGIIGFIFGIPRTMQKTSLAEDGSEVAPNTNLEQISDWLTKILVGVGLTQVNSISSHFSTLATNAGKALAPSQDITINAYTIVSSLLRTRNPEPPDYTIFAGALMIFFALEGFLICYLWTRLVLMHIQKTGLGEEVAKMRMQDDYDKHATTVVFRQLNHSADTPNMSTDELYEIMKLASGRTISEIFIMAVNYRKVNWKKNPACVSKTVPVFESLILLDTENHYPENYAQLGYALKDKVPPDYAMAIRHFTRAISEFEKNGVRNGLSTIYFNRALSQILLEGKFPTERSAPETIMAVNADIQAAMIDDLVAKVIPETMIPEWQKLNNDPPTNITPGS